jgi:hypothetical protein
MAERTPGWAQSGKLNPAETSRLGDYDHKPHAHQATYAEPGTVAAAPARTAPASVSMYTNSTAATPSTVVSRETNIRGNAGETNRAVRQHKRGTQPTEPDALSIAIESPGLTLVRREPRNLRPTATDFAQMAPAVAACVPTACGLAVTPAPRV